MKPILVLPILAGVTFATEIPDLLKQLPECSVKCLVQGAMDHGCSAIDYKCQCAKTEAITKTVSPCLVQAGCRLKEIGVAAETIAAVCVKIAAQAGGQTSNPPAASNGANGPSQSGTPNVPAAAARGLSAAWGGAAAIAVFAALL